MIEHISAHLHLPVDANEQKILFNTLGPETQQDISRSGVEMRDDGGSTVLEISADDIGAARAAVNSYLRWIDTSIKIYQDTKGER